MLLLLVFIMTLLSFWITIFLSSEFFSIEDDAFTISSHKLNQIFRCKKGRWNV